MTRIVKADLIKLTSKQILGQNARMIGDLTTTGFLESETSLVPTVALAYCLSSFPLVSFQFQMEFWFTQSLIFKRAELVRHDQILLTLVLTQIY